MAIIGIILTLLFSLISIGLINKTRNILSGRRGSPVLQPYRDMLKHFRKDSIFSHTSSWITQVAPSINLACTLTVLLFIPFGHYGSVLSFNSDLVLFAFILGFGKFMMMLAALDSGSAFQGMGTNREALYNVLVEPVFFILMGSIALIYDNVSLSGLLSKLNVKSALGYEFEFVTCVIFFMISLVETKRIPFDDPKTHLELTMIHEVMILDYSGIDLAIIQLTSGIKHALYGALIAAIVVPHNMPLGFTILGYFIILTLNMILIGFVESTIARFRMNRNPRFIISMASLSIIILIMALILKTV